MQDLVAFLRERLDEDAAVASNGQPDPEAPSSGRWTAYDAAPGTADRGTGRVHLVGAVPGDPSRTRGMDWAVCETGQITRAASIAAHIARHDPARVLAEVEAKRKAIEMYERLADISSDDWTGLDAVEQILKAFGLAYADHPDYREEWRPL